jgi:hypothetical protein
MPPRLTPLQREASRLDATGIPPSEIARQVGVAAETISRWRGDLAYQRAVDRLQADMDRDTLKQVRTLRAAALKAVRVALARSLHGLNEAPALEAVKVGEFALRVYTATSAQTGRPMQHDVNLHGPGGGPVIVRPDVLRSLPDHELAAATRALSALVEVAVDDDDLDAVEEADE